MTSLEFAESFIRTQRKELEKLSDKIGMAEKSIRRPMQLAYLQLLLVSRGRLRAQFFKRLFVHLGVDRTNNAFRRLVRSLCCLYIRKRCMVCRMRPHYLDSTISRPICEVKQGQVWLVLAWGTSWEVQMLHIFFHFFSFFSCFFAVFGSVCNHLTDVTISSFFHLFSRFFSRARV